MSSSRVEKRQFAYAAMAAVNGAEYASVPLPEGMGAGVEGGGVCGKCQLPCGSGNARTKVGGEGLLSCHVPAG